MVCYADNTLVQTWTLVVRDAAPCRGHGGVYYPASEEVGLSVSSAKSEAISFYDPCGEHLRPAFAWTLLERMERLRVGLQMRYLGLTIDRLWTFELVVPKVAAAANVLCGGAGVREAWRDRGGLPLTFRTTQVLTGYGAFGEYLLRIRRVTHTCHQCQEEQHTWQHTLEFCPAWADPYRVLQLASCESLAPSAIAHAMLWGQQKYLAFRSFYEQVKGMFAKELAERVRKRQRHPSRIQHRRGRHAEGVSEPPHTCTTAPSPWC
ncbi:uncharacterized protein LOC122568407 [Bombus pyrosoma]|uniref:uncharacterized protein LOC122568407 n=1 Tax=Bombus pyrosoma TaxID=396416 RepID=UPI001CB8CFCF|nr:uncharacterized protein LOC122568407 [Bombus pyrosoma]